jgi:hypothetical protein
MVRENLPNYQIGKEFPTRIPARSTTQFDANLSILLVTPSACPKSISVAVLGMFAIRSIAFHFLERGQSALLADTKTAEYLAEQVVAGEFTGDLAQGVLGQPQVLGE